MKELLKLGAIVIIVWGAALGFLAFQGRNGPGLKAGDVAPALRLPVLGGGELDIAAYRGQVVLLNVWATWCAPCVEEMPSLERLHEVLGSQGLVVLGVSVDEDTAVLERFTAEKRIRFPVLRDPGGRATATAYRTTGYPVTFLIDGGGAIQEIFVGPAQWDTPDAIAYFRGLLSSSPTSP